MGTGGLELEVFRSVVVDAVTAAPHRAEELGKSEGCVDFEMSDFTNGCDAV